MYAYEKENDKSTYATNFCDRIPIPDDSTKISLVSLCAKIHSVDTWLNVLSENYACRCCAYQDNTHEIFKRIPTEIPEPTPEYSKKNFLHF